MASGMTSKDVEIAKRRAVVADWYLGGKTQMQIADVMGVNQATVSRDLQALQVEWTASAVRDLDDAKAQELAKIDRLEREYWEAWQDSKGKRTVTSKKLVDTPSKDKDEQGKATTSRKAEASTREEELLGDPRFLAGVQWCIERRCKLLGIDAPSKQDIRWNFDLAELTEGQLARLAAGDDPANVIGITSKS